MPFRSDTGGFTGNGNMGDFIDQIVETFLTDAKGSGGLGWTSHTPSRGKGTSPKFEFIFSRGGASPVQLPVWAMQTAAKTLYVYSGNDVDVTQESFDQPGNPVNSPPSDPVNDQTGGIHQPRCTGVSTAVGPYDGYWVFGGETAEYCHVVLKVGAREYRHFHCGLLTPLHTDFPADAFYVTGHRWGYLAPDNLYFNSNAGTNSSNWEHQPYERHILPFSNNAEQNRASNVDGRSRGMWVYVPGGYGTEGYEWWLMVGEPVSESASGGGDGTVPYGQWKNTYQPGNVRSVEWMFKDIGDVNTNKGSPQGVGYIEFGAGFVSGNQRALGTIPWAADPTFTTDGVALLPIYVGLHSDFASALRWSPVAQVPDVYRVNMKSLDAEQEITIGSDTYVVFPLMNNDANNTVAGEGYSGYEGLAYRKITANAT